jgi:excinuclease ABC subunit C
MNKLFLDNLPTSPGVYKMLDDQIKILYMLAKAGNLKKRVSSYFMRSNHSIKNQRLDCKNKRY